MKHPFLSGLCSVMLLLVLSGCWDHYELNNMAIVSGIAIDAGKHDKYKVTLEVINPGEMTSKKLSGNMPSVVYSYEGKSVVEAIRRINTGIPRKMLYSHIQLVVVSEEIAREGLLSFLDYFESNREFRENVNFVMTHGSPAEDTLKISHPMVRVSSFKIVSQMELGEKEWGSDPMIKLRDFILAWQSDTKEPLLGAIRVKGDVQKGNQITNMRKIEPSALVELAGSGVFHHNQLLGFLSLGDTRNVLWVQGKLKQSVLTFGCGEPGKMGSYNVINSSTKKKVNYTDGKLKIDISISIQSYISFMECKVRLSDNQEISRLQKQIEAYMEDQIKGTVSKVQHKYKADIFGFGDLLDIQQHQQYNKLKSNWSPVFEDADVKVKVTANIRQSGITTDSFLLKAPMVRPENEQEATEPD
ncbi:Ger(x)C family spore germination protein [Paenibacillus glycanilyticus]|uniref:Ger(X)C family spore germination protein n=1 Tax=Paenibacillus glycanilyticus TaxID=126569 RepID=A0ABQ6GAF5_9BACL|nr:Ger(x)C family spore germination protein [Paenibacillus glycanilyticus]GLX67015.1 hypothetical protein MU1_13590 [Paenibacillus glycanilyticus]